MKALDSVIDDILKRGAVRIGTTCDYLPFTWLEDGEDISQVRGADIEMAKSLAQAMGVRAEFVKTTWPTLLDDLRAQRFDIAMGGIARKPARALAGMLSIPYLEFGKTAAVRASDRGKYRTLADINKPGVVAVSNPGGTNEAFMRERLDQCEATVWPDNRTIYERVAGGHADVFVSDNIEVLLHVGMDPRLCAPIDGAFTSETMGYMLPRDPAWKHFVDTWLEGEMRRPRYGLDWFLEIGRAILAAREP